MKKRILDGESWLWCLHCERFFQAKDLTKDCTGGREGCAFPPCGGAGLGVDIYAWDDWYKQEKERMPHWPKSTAGLTKGMVCCLYPGDEEKRVRPEGSLTGKRKVKVVRLPGLSERCPVCQGPLTELLDARGMPSFLDRRLSMPGGLWCNSCELWFERDGNGGLLGEVELWDAEAFPSGGENGRQKTGTGD